MAKFYRGRCRNYSHYRPDLKYSKSYYCSIGLCYESKIKLKEMGLICQK